MQLVSIDDVKLDLGIADGDRDALIGRLVTRASAEVAQVVGYPIPRATREHVEAVRHPSRRLLVPFLPLHDVRAVTVDGVTWFDLDAAEPSQPAAGFSFTEWGQIEAPDGCHFRGRVEVRLVSGYRLADTGTPGEERDLPVAFEAAVAEIVRQRLNSVGRDDNVRAESVPGVYSVTFGSDTPSAVGVPPSVWQMLAPYRLVRAA